MEIISESENILKKYNQDKVLKILQNASEENKEKLVDQIINFDFEEIIKLYNNKDKKIENSTKIEPIEYIDKYKITDMDRKKYQIKGEEIIRNNKYAVVTMAGGQGTRLGHKGPKGTFKLDIGENGKYIFEILTDIMKKANEKYNTEVYWYIMTGEDNNDETINFFEQHKYFEYNKEKIKFFKQGVLPLMDVEGNILINKNYEIRKASNGNGGIYKALKDSYMLEDIKSKGIEWVYVCGVDNIMVNPVDAEFLGVAIESKKPSASKSVVKAYPEEKVGVFCKKDGKPSIIEYIEISEEMRHAIDKNGEFLYGESNIVNHLFNIDSLEKMANCELKYHCAFKKNSYIDENGIEINPAEPNSYKFEEFIFDAFEYLDDMIIYRVKREEEFAPVKNAEGKDSPESAKKIYENFHKEK